MIGRHEVWTRGYIATSCSYKNAANIIVHREGVDSMGNTNLVIVLFQARHLLNMSGQEKMAVNIAFPGPCGHVLYSEHTIT